MWYFSSDGIEMSESKGARHIMTLLMAPIWRNPTTSSYFAISTSGPILLNPMMRRKSISLFLTSEGPWIAINILSPCKRLFSASKQTAENCWAFLCAKHFKELSLPGTPKLKIKLSVVWSKLRRWILMILMSILRCWKWMNWQLTLTG